MLPGNAHREFYDQDMRAFVVARSRYAEDTLARAVAAGVRQYVLLGAGLDTFAYRNPFIGVRVFEVDHHSTQAWKRELLSAASIPIPEHLTFAPVDFESQSLEEGLSAARFQWDQPAFFWLGNGLAMPLLGATSPCMCAPSGEVQTRPVPLHRP